MMDAALCAAGFLLQLKWLLEDEKGQSVSGPLARQGWSLFPFAGEQDGISIPVRRAVFMTLTAAASHDLGTCPCQPSEGIGIS